MYICGAGEAGYVGRAVRWLAGLGLAGMTARGLLLVGALWDEFVSEGEAAAYGANLLAGGAAAYAEERSGWGTRQAGAALRSSG